MKQTKTDKKLKKPDQQMSETAYLKFYETYKLMPTLPSSSITENLAEGKKENKDIQVFEQFFVSNEKLPKFIHPEDLRNLLGNRPGTFYPFLQHPTFLDMVLGVSPDCEPVEKIEGDAFINGLNAKIKTNINRINKEIEERNKDEKRNAEINKIKEEINKVTKEIDKIEEELAKRNAEVDKIKEDGKRNEERKAILKRTEEVEKIRKELAKKNAELSKIREPDERNKSEKDDWLNLKKTFTIYIAPKLYSDLMKYVHMPIIDITKLHDFNKKLIDYWLETDPLPRDIEQKTLCKIILRAPVIMSVFFQHLNFFKRLMGFSLDNTKDANANEIWEDFHERFTIKLKTIMAHQQINTKIPVMEQLTQSRYKEIFDCINRNQELLNKQVAEKDYEKTCQDFAAVIDINSVNTRKFIKLDTNSVTKEVIIGFNPLGVPIKKEIPGCLTASHLRQLVMFAPEYAIQYMDNYYFMSRLLADVVKKGNTLLATGIFNSLNRGELAKFTSKDKIKLSFECWEIRLRLNIGIAIFIKELREFVPTATDKSEEAKETLNFSDKQVVDTVVEKLLKISTGSIRPMEYQWIEQLSALMKKLPKSLTDNKIVMEINNYLIETYLLEGIKTRAQSLRRETMPVVIADTEEHTTSFRP